MWRIHQSQTGCNLQWTRMCPMPQQQGRQDTHCPSMWVLRLLFIFTLLTYPWPFYFSSVTASLPNIYSWVCACLQYAGKEIARCMGYGAQTRPFLCGHVSPRLIARYELAWKLNVKMFLRHPEHPYVQRHHDSVMSVICQTFPSPEWDNKKHLITKIQRNHDKFFIEAMCTLFVLCSMSPSAERQKAPRTPRNLLNTTLSCKFRINVARELRDAFTACVSTYLKDWVCPGKWTTTTMTTRIFLLHNRIMFIMLVCWASWKRSVAVVEVWLLVGRRYLLANDPACCSHITCSSKNLSIWWHIYRTIRAICCCML